MFTFSLSISAFDIWGYPHVYFLIVQFSIRYLGISTCLRSYCLFQYSIFGDIHMFTFSLSISVFDILGYPHVYFLIVYFSIRYLGISTCLRSHCLFHTFDNWVYPHVYVLIVNFIHSILGDFHMFTFSLYISALNILEFPHVYVLIVYFIHSIFGNFHMFTLFLSISAFDFWGYPHVYVPIVYFSIRYSGISIRWHIWNVRRWWISRSL